MTAQLQIRRSICQVCDAPISITIIVGSQRWDDVNWVHRGAGSEPMPPHNATPELRIVIDATCPGCAYPEIGYAPQRTEFVCSRCGHTQQERPAA